MKRETVTLVDRGNETRVLMRGTAVSREHAGASNSNASPITVVAKVDIVAIYVAAVRKRVR
jgi:hypothetical protein